MKIPMRKTLVLSALTASLATSALVHFERADAVSSNLFAQVSAAGALVTGNGANTVTHLGTGQYEVTFAQNVSACAYVSTSALNAGQSLQSYTAGGHLGTSGVYVEVKNQGGGLTDSGFSLSVNCGGTGLAYAVVAPNGSLARGSAGAAVTNLGVGRYSIDFGASVSTCAYLATVGASDNTLVFNPAGVYTGSSTTVGDVYIETKNPGGGLSSGIPFHVSVVCPNAPNTKSVIFNPGGLSNRANGGTSAFRESTGSYLAVTSRAVNTCVTIATRGSINTGVPLNPTTVEVSAGPATNVTRITERKLAFLGGTLFNDAVHVSFIC